MRFILMICLFLASFAAQAQYITISLENANGRPFIKWSPDPNFSYSIYRRTENTDFELVESGYKGGWYTDKTAESSTPYYYKVIAESKELKYRTATVLLKSFDLTDPANHRWLGGAVTKSAEGLILTPHPRLSTINVVTGLNLDQSKKYVMKLTLGNVESTTNNQTMSITMGNFACLDLKSKDIRHLVEYANSTFECVLESRGGKPSEQNNPYIILGGSSFKVEFKKIELMGYE